VKEVALFRHYELSDGIPVQFVYRSVSI
jgi:hypothetical protein